MGDHVRTASNAPGALPDSPNAPRILNVSHFADGQNLCSESTYEKPTFGYGWSPKSSPNALLPSTRKPSVMKARSRHPICSCANSPAFTTRRRVSVPTVRTAPLVSTGSPGPENSVAVMPVWNSWSWNTWPPNDVVDTHVLPNSFRYDDA